MANQIVLFEQVFDWMISDSSKGSERRRSSRPVMSKCSVEPILGGLTIVGDERPGTSPKETELLQASHDWLDELISTDNGAETEMIMFDAC